MLGVGHLGQSTASWPIWLRARIQQFAPEIEQSAHTAAGKPAIDVGAHAGVWNASVTRVGWNVSGLATTEAAVPPSTQRQAIADEYVDRTITHADEAGIHMRGQVRHAVVARIQQIRPVPSRTAPARWRCSGSVAPGCWQCC